MCGISVFIDKKNLIVPDELIKRMNNRIRHRGPDGEDYYFGDHFALGHRMLKITDFSSKGIQPMSFYNCTIVYNGEIYNYKEIRERLKAEGYSFYTQTDTEVILAAYNKWGNECIRHFDGMWAFVLYDKNKQLLFCSRDRFGIKPLCYTQLQNKFLIGSEIKQFTAIADFVPAINKKTAFDFLYNGKIDNTEQSFFEGVYFLPAGCHLIYNLKTHSYNINRWYDINTPRSDKAASFDEATNIFKDIFTQSVLTHIQAKVPVGSCLSGGLDSSAIAGIAKQTSNRVTTFSSCYIQHGYNEIEYINNAIMHYNFPSHKTYPSIHELLENKLLNKIVYHQDQPILSGSFFSEYKVFQSAAINNIRIMLSGQGADEYLGGYGEFSLLNLRVLFKKLKWGKLFYEIKNTASVQSKSFKEVLKTFLIFGLGIPHFKQTVRKPAFFLECFNKRWLDQFEYGNAHSFSFKKVDSISDLSKLALCKYSLPHQLHSEDRNAMLHSIESRLPFLDHKLVEWCLSLPDNFIIHKGVTKKILRESLKNVLPPEIYNRHSKLGFPGPEEALFTHHYGYIQEQLREYSQLFPDIFSDGLLKLHHAYYNNKAGYDNLLFRALSFGTWAKEFGMAGNSEQHPKNIVESQIPKVNFQN